MTKFSKSMPIFYLVIFLLITNNTYRHMSQNRSTKREKKDKKEWFDSTKEAKQERSNNRTQVSNLE